MNLKKFRKLKNKTQKDVAKFLNIAESTYRGYENGTSEPSINTLIKLADFYNTTVDELIRNFECATNSSESDLLKLFRKLNIIEQNKLIGYLSVFCEQKNT